MLEVTKAEIETDPLWLKSSCWKEHQAMVQIGKSKKRVNSISNVSKLHTSVPQIESTKKGKGCSVNVLASSG